MTTMTRFNDWGVALALPPDWRDRTIVAFQAPAGADDGGRSQKTAAPNIVITKERIRDGDTLRIHADRQLLDLSKVLSEFDILESREAQLGGRPAIYMRFAWRSPQGPMEQSLTMVERDTDGRRAVTTFTTSTPRDQAEAARMVFEGILASVEFDELVPAPQHVGPTPRSSGIAPKPDSLQMPRIPMPGRWRERG
jgi:hypothetical protein